MLRTIFSTALLAAIFMVLVPGTALAQSQANADVTATATVMTALTITKNTNVGFGNVGATTAGVVYLNPKGLATSNYVGTTATVGTLTIAGANSQSVDIVWPASISLTGTPSGTLTYTLEVNGYTANTQASSSVITSGAGVTTSATGGYYLWVGGNIGQLAAQTAGSYTGTANFTVEYN